MVNVYGEVDLDAVDRAATDVAGALRALGGAQAISTDAAPLAPAMRIDLNFRLALRLVGRRRAGHAQQAAPEKAACACIYDAGLVDLVVTGPEVLRRDPEGIDNPSLRFVFSVSVPCAWSPMST